MHGALLTGGGLLQQEESRASAHAALVPAWGAAAGALACMGRCGVHACMSLKGACMHGLRC
jgi:hypothetical protein